MKHLSKYLVVALALTLMVMLAACAKQPTQEMDAAKVAVDAAIAAGGDKYAKEEVKGLNDELTAATDEIKVQDGKFFKNYDKATEILAKVKANADTLTTEIPAKKEKAKNDAQAAIDAAKAAVNDAKALLAKAPRGKGTKADIEALRADVAGLEASITEAEGLMGTEDYMAASDKANGVKDKAAEVSSQISQAIEKVKGKK
ncbi:MAG: hypothetical protein Q8N09_10390 [Thermodesulfovibrionia bacterium]|nr:hypothetical protein [Thermodesulfovibrionia bacterium]